MPIRRQYMICTVAFKSSLGIYGINFIEYFDFIKSHALDERLSWVVMFYYTDALQVANRLNSQSYLGPLSWTGINFNPSMDK